MDKELDMLSQQIFKQSSENMTSSCVAEVGRPTDLVTAGLRDVMTAFVRKLQQNIRTKFTNFKQDVLTELDYLKTSVKSI